MGPLFACIQRSVLSGICFYLLSLLCNGFCVVFCQHLRSDPTSVQALIKTNTNYYLSRTLRPACSQGPLLSCLLLSTACCQLLVSEWCPDFGGVVALPVVAILDSVIAFKPFESIKYHHSVLSLVEFLPSLGDSCCHRLVTANLVSTPNLWSPSSPTSDDHHLELLTSSFGVGFKHCC